MNLLRGARSLLSVILVGLWFVFGSLVLRLLVVPASFLLPARQYDLIGLYMKMMSAGILLLLRAGGARVRRVGRVRNRDGAVFVVASHQSLTDILQITLLAERVPAFVTRARYRRFIPLVSTSIRMLDSPLVDPKRDPVGAIERIRAGAALPHGVAIFPEGHRSRDGRIRPFRTAGIEALLSARRRPVYLVMNDGVWRVARFTDLLFRVHLIDAYSEVMGPFEPPADPAEWPAFVKGLRARLAARLEEHRREEPAAPR
jgi:1-acyl-sn-glycerol-3-phosphate acyltransferase